MSESKAWTRCVLLLSPGSGDSAHAKSLLAARDWHVVEQRDAYLALADLCIRRRAMVSRAAWGLAGQESQALVIAEPHQQPDLDELVAALRKYVPGAPILMVEKDRLVSLDESPDPIASSIDHSPPDPDPGLIELPSIRRKPLRLVTSDHETPNPPRSESKSPSEDTQEDNLAAGITPEEIDMLLNTPQTRENAP